MSGVGRSKYVLLDVSNGDALEPRNAARIYFWEFPSLSKAQAFLKRHTKLKSHSELIGPFKRGRGGERFGGTYCFWDRTED